MRRAVRFVSLASSSFAFGAGAAIFVMMVLVTVDVLLRFLGGGVPATLEIVAHYLMVMVVFLPLAKVEQLDAMISVDVVFVALGPRAKRAMVLFASLVSLPVYGLLAWLTWLDALHHASVRTYVFAMQLQLPTWPGYFILPVALTLAAVVILARLFEIIMGSYDLDGDSGHMPGLTSVAGADRAPADGGGRP